jgi:hypothetical protein
MKKTARPTSPSTPEVVYFALNLGAGTETNSAWHQMQLLRIAEEARAAAKASGRDPLPAARKITRTR